MFIQDYLSPLGKMLLCEKDGRLYGVWFYDQKYKAISVENPINFETPFLRQTKLWLDDYFRGILPDYLPELDLHGTDLAKAVYQILLEIPYGSVMTYGEIAKQMATKTGKTSISSQAIGQAVGHNPISILIPCHRVIGVGGKLIGYAGGIDRKAYLLNLESKGGFHAHIE